ncbi:MAG: OmpP1/FadL family transporter [Elusimicrobiales bacterium]|nr:OmpP1/FadL family transporter [Elusimicrobiales bacterium]
MNIIVLILVALMGLASSVNAAGFRLADQDAKATGMANAYTAVADNASAVWYNPAAITNLEGTNVSLGTVMIAPSMEHKNTAANGGATDEIANRLHIPPHFYATHKINDQWSLGLGVNAPFGLSTEWERLTAFTRTVATKSKVQAVNYNLNGGYKLNDKFSFAAGVDYAMVNAVLNRQVTDAIPANLDGEGNGMGYNVAAMYKHNDKWNFGASYRSQIKVTLEGDLATNTIAPVEADLTLPDMLQIGAAYKFNDKWTFAADIDYTNWTTYRNIIVINQNTLAETKDIKNWKSVYAFRLGTEYKYSDTWKFRAGSFYDMNPVRKEHFETRVPDSDRVAFAIGAGWNKNNLTVDVSYMYLMFLERSITNTYAGTASTVNTKLDGKYNSIAHLPAITIGYKF